MAKKETLNPITAFRKANEARKTVVVKSLKKAQAGIAQDTSAAQQPVQKYFPVYPEKGGKGNFKLETPTVKAKTPDYWLKPTGEYADPKTNPRYNPKPPASSQSASSQFSGSQALPARLADMKKKNGGPVKRKK